MLSIILWTACSIWFLAGILCYGIEKHTSTYAIFLGRQRGDTVTPYRWKDELRNLRLIFAGPIGLPLAILGLHMLREQAELTEIGIALGFRPHLIGNKLLLHTITRAKSWGFRLSVPHECRQ